MFINYDENTGLSINTYRHPGGYANSDVAGLVDDILAGHTGCCPLEGAIAVLEDGGMWAGSNATPALLEELHLLATEYEAGQRLDDNQDVSPRQLAGEVFQDKLDMYRSEY